MRPLFFWIVLLGLLLTGCSQLNPTPAPTPTLPATATPAPTLPATAAPTATPTVFQGTITIWHAWTESDISALVQIIANFQELYPNIQFDVLYVPLETLRARYEVATREGSGPTLLLGPSPWGPGLEAAGAVADLSGLVDPGPLNPAAVQSGLVNGKTVSLPYTVRGVVLYRNRAVIPEASSTFTDMSRVARAATQGDTFGAFLDRGFPFSGGHLEAQGGQWLDPANGSPVFEGESGLAWVELLRQFEALGPAEVMTDRDLELFKAGKVGWMVDGTWNLTTLLETVGMNNLAIDPWPSSGSGQKLAGFVQSDSVYLSSKASATERTAAEAFLSYFFTPEAQGVMVSVRRIPAHTGVEIVDPLLAQAAVALAGGVPYPNSPAFEAYIEPMNAALRSIFNEQVAPEDALRTAAERIRADLARFTPTPAP